MMLSAVPAWICVTETTARSIGSTTRETTCWSPLTTCAAAVTGSTDSCGAAPWPPLPRISIPNTSEAAVCGPGSTPTLPSGSSEKRCAPDHHVDALHDACLDELARAPWPELLRVLEDEADLARQLVAPLVERVQRREQHRRVAVVAARVHDAGVLGGELEAGLLLDGKRVDVGAQRERLPRPPGAQRGDEARLRRPLELDAFHAAEQLEEERRRLVLREAQLRVLMEVAPPGDRLRFQLRCHQRAHGRSLLTFD